MNHLQAQHIREMDEFKSANQAYGSELLKLDNNNITRSGHYRSSEDQVRRCVPDYYYYAPPSSNKMSTSSSTASTWNDNNNINNNNNNNNKNKKNYQIQRKSAEVKRQRRVVKYKAYAVEGKVKASLREGFRWVKNKYIHLVHGYY